MTDDDMNMGHFKGWCPRCKERVQMSHHGVNANACRVCGLVNISNSQAGEFDDNETLKMRSPNEA